MSITIIQADYQNRSHQKAIPFLLNEYAKHPMGGNKALLKENLDKLVESLASKSFAYSALAFDQLEAVGLINYFEGFSTFSCKPLFNIHDAFVLPSYQGQGISQLLLSHVEQHAKNVGCCKITLEVLSNNEAAKLAYLKYGFSAYELDPSKGSALFWQKLIT